jgi:hypothetical protein
MRYGNIYNLCFDLYEPILLIEFNPDIKFPEIFFLTDSENFLAKIGFQKCFLVTIRSDIIYK